MRISVVIPTYNRGHSIGEAIDSVLSQSRPADEVIIVDDGSTDNTLEVLATYGDAIQVIAQANAGVSAARNAGCDKATGDWLTFLDSDDLWMVDRLAILERDIASAPPEVVAHLGNMELTGPGYSSMLFKERGIVAPTGEATPNDFALARAVAGLFTQSAAIRKDAFHKAGGFEVSLRTQSDVLLFSRLSLAGTFLFTADPVAIVRRLEGDDIMLSGLESKDPVTYRSRLVGIYTRLAEGELPPRARDQVMRSLSWAHHRVAEVQWSRDRSQALRSLRLAAKSHPDKLRGVAKSLLPLLLGQRGFRAARKTENRISRA